MGSGGAEWVHVEDRGMMGFVGDGDGRVMGGGVDGFGR